MSLGSEGQSMKDPKRTADRRIARLIAFGVILYAVVMNLEKVGTTLAWLLSVFSSIILGLIVALVLDVPMHAFQNLFEKLDRKGKCSARLKNALALILAVLAVPIVLFVLLRFIIPQFVSAVTNVVAIVRASEPKIGAFIESLGFESEFILGKLNELGDWISSNLTTIASTAVSTVVSMFASVSDVVLAVILAIYILADKAALRRRARLTLRAFLPERVSAYVCRCTDMFISTFRTFLALQCLEAVILGVLILICMLIFRLPYAATISGVTALLALIPYVGAYLSLAIGCVLIVTISPMKALIFVIIFLVAQQLEGNVIYPRVVGRSVGLPAYVTLSAVMLGGAIAGIAGMFFVIPIASVAYVLLREAVRKRNAEKDACKKTEKSEGAPADDHP